MVQTINTLFYLQNTLLLGIVPNIIKIQLKLIYTYQNHLCLMEFYLFLEILSDCCFFCSLALLKFSLKLITYLWDWEIWRLSSCSCKLSYQALFFCKSTWKVVASSFSTVLVLGAESKCNIIVIHILLKPSQHFQGTWIKLCLIYIYLLLQLIHFCFLFLI